MTAFSAWEKTGKYYTYKDQYKIFYQEAGSGTPLLLLHGFPTASWDWHKIWKPLTQRYSLFAPDFIGFGYSDKPKSYHYSIHDQADVIEHGLATLNITEAHILAHDYGDTVLQELLARNIDRNNAGQQGFNIQSVALLNGGLFPETHIARPIQKALIGPFGFILPYFLYKNSVRKTFSQVFGKDTQASEQEIDEFYHLITYNKGKYLFHKLIRYMADRKEHRSRWVSALQNAPVPIRLINGASDPVSGIHMTERYRELVPNPDIVLLDKIGHYPQTEAPKAVLDAYLDFRSNIEKTS